MVQFDIISKLHSIFSRPFLLCPDEAFTYETTVKAGALKKIAESLEIKLMEFKS